MTKKESDAAYYKKNKLRLIAQSMQWQRENRQAYLARLKAHYRKNRDARRAKAKQDHILNRAKNCARAKAWRINNPERYKRRKRVYYDQNQESLRAKKRDYYAKNSELLISKSRAWRIANPEKKNLYENRRRARKLSAPIGGSVAIVAWEKRWKSKSSVVCYWCQVRFSPKECQTDHIVPLAKGGPHSVENLCISCDKCNFRKNASTPQEWNKRLTQPALLI